MIREGTMCIIEKYCDESRYRIELSQVRMKLNRFKALRIENSIENVGRKLVDG